MAPAAAASFDVTQGSLIKAVWVEIWWLYVGDADTSASFNMTIEKLPANVASMTFTQSVNLGSYTNKKNIFYATQGVTGPAREGAPSLPLHRAFILIPKGKQRMGLSDRLVVNVSNTSAGSAQICGIFTYKEYR